MKLKSADFTCYPLQFQPILKNRIWGGDKLSSLGKNLTGDTIGESWEISMVEDNISVIANGVYKNQSLADIINQYPIEVLGTKVYEKFGRQFPLLFKFLDAKTDLSIQLHPNDELAKKRHNAFGKTEMWYIMQADPQARIILGFKKDSSPDEYLQHLKNKTLPSVLRAYNVQKGDVYFIETGTIHAIGGGILLAEIQQTSDITYRVYDWDRVDEQGNARELHIDLALKAIDYRAKETQVMYDKSENKANKLIDSPFFTTNYIDLTDSLEINKSAESFLVYICTEGSCELETPDFSFTIQQGSTLLLPAVLTRFSLKGKATLLEVYINTK